MSNSAFRHPWLVSEGHARRVVLPFRPLTLKESTPSSPPSTGAHLPIPLSFRLTRNLNLSSQPEPLPAHPPYQPPPTTQRPLPSPSLRSPDRPLQRNCPPSFPDSSLRTWKDPWLHPHYSRSRVLCRISVHRLHRSLPPALSPTRLPTTLCRLQSRRIPQLLRASPGPLPLPLP